LLLLALLLADGVELAKAEPEEASVSPVADVQSNESRKAPNQPHVGGVSFNSFTRSRPEITEAALQSVNVEATCAKRGTMSS